MSGKKAKPKAASRKFRIISDQLPIRVDMPDGDPIVYDKKGMVFAESDWPMAHRTIPSAIKSGLIEEVN